MPTADERWSDDTLAALARDEPFLRRLALRLVRDPGTADDLVQETWLRVFSLRPAHGEGLFGWSATVMRRLAARQRRGEGRRAAREAAAARPERQDDPLEAVQRRVDAQALLVTALRRLSPEQREALVLRHAEERSLADIAARQGTTIAGVKSRLAHGMAALRADLDRRAGAERGAYGVVLAPLLAPALRRGPWLTAGSPTLTLAGGTLLMGNTLKLSFVAVTLVAIAWITRQLGDGPRPTDPTSPAVAADADSTLGDLQVALEGAAMPPVRIAGLAAAAEEKSALVNIAERELVVRVTGPSGRTAKVLIHAQPPIGSRVGEQQRARLQVDVPGEARCALGPLVLPLRDGIAVGALRIGAEAEGCGRTSIELPLELDQGEATLEVDLVLLEKATIVGTVSKRSRRMFVQAYAVESGDRLGRPIGSANIDGEDDFVVQVDHAGAVALVVLTNDHQPATARCRVIRGQVSHVGPLECAPAVAIEGVVMSGEATTAGARIVAERIGVTGQTVSISPSWIKSIHGTPTQLAWVGGTFVLTRCEAMSGVDGTFHVGMLTPGDHAVAVPGLDASRAPSDPTRETVTINAPAAGVRLGAGWAELRLEFEAPQALEGMGMLRFGDPGSTQQVAWLQAEDLISGRVRTLVLSPGVTKELCVEFPGYESVVLRVRAERAGEVLRRTVRLERPAASARLTVELTGIRVYDGAPFLLLEPRVTSADDPGAALLPEMQSRSAPARGGRVTFEGLSPTTRTLRLVPGRTARERHGNLADVMLDVELRPDGEHTVAARLEYGSPLRVRALDPEGKPTAARVRVRDAAGAHVPTLFVTYHPGWSTSTSSLDEHTAGAGWNHVVPNLAAGEYVLEVEAEGQARRDLRVRLTAGVQNEVTAQF